MCAPKLAMELSLRPWGKVVERPCDHIATSACSGVRNPVGPWKLTSGCSLEKCTAQNLSSGSNMARMSNSSDPAKVSSGSNSRVALHRAFQEGANKVRLHGLAGPCAARAPGQKRPQGGAAAAQRLPGRAVRQV